MNPILWPYAAAQAPQQSLLGNQPPMTPVPAGGLLSQPEMRAYEPSIRENIANWIAGGSGPGARRDLANRIAGVGRMSGLDVLPGLGDLMAFNEAQSPLDYSLAALGLIPALGDAAGPLAKQLLKVSQDYHALPKSKSQLDAARKAADPRYTEMSASMLRKPLGEYKAKYETVHELPNMKQLTPEDLQGGVGFNIPGDRTRGGTRVVDIDGKPIEGGVLNEGGGPHSQIRQAQGIDSFWASGENAALPFPGAVDQLLREGVPGMRNVDPDKVFAWHSLMGGDSGDFSKQVLHTIPALARTMDASPKAIEDFNDFARNIGMQTGEKLKGGGYKRVTFPDFPGIESPKLKEWIDAQPASRSKWLPKMLDKKKFLNAGLPDVQAARIAQNNPLTHGMPKGAGGMHIGKWDANNNKLFELDAALRHGDYPLEFPGKLEGSFGTYMPLELMSPQFTLGEAAQGIRPADAYQRYNKTDPFKRMQVFDQQWVDTTMPIYEAGGLLTPEGRELAKPFQWIVPF